jgi:peptidoglycan/LPS O-acetylase OafA/YrhL
MERRFQFIRWATLAAGCLWLLFPALPPGISVRMGFFNDTISAVAFGLFILNVLLIPRGPVARVLSTAPARLLGNMAYSTYLFHPILLCVVFRALRGVDPRLNTTSDLPPLALAFVLTIACSWISWTRFEAPLVARGRRFHY